MHDLARPRNPEIRKQVHAHKDRGVPARMHESVLSGQATRRQHRQEYTPRRMMVPAKLQLTEL
jgi:hypothetical protein